MRVVVCGSRDFADLWAVASVLDGVRMGIGDDPEFIIIQGECPYGGADALAKQWAATWGWPCESFPPANREGWDRPTSYEFHARNRAMIDSGADLCIAFVNKPLENSRGTLYTVNYARQHGVKTIVVEVR